VSDIGETVVTEGMSFIERHPELNSAQADMGGLTWGLMRALYECPVCGPGQYRYTPKDHHDWMVCSKCQNVWVYNPRQGKKGREVEP